ncbi:MAG: RNA-binding protein [delta proteobacterium ML8_F1]|nr:MAG: RNA-binding protein [delta proteobacterium ML8_F1]
MKEIGIKEDFIKLDQFLKYVDIASSGGHSKFLIRSGCVRVNGHHIVERGKKIRPGDIVKVTIEDEDFNRTFRIVKE